MSRTILFQVGQGRRDESGARRYGVAGAILASERELPELEPFRVRSPLTAPSPPIAARGVSSGDRATVLFEDQAWVGGRRARVVCSRLARGYRIAVEAGGSFEVAADGSHITWLEEGGESLDTLQRQTLLGPCLSLALAAQGVFCLHAAAVCRASAAWALIGESGSGKSTLAGELSRGTGAELLADDLLPVSLEGDRLLALPRFPQLKMEPGEQWGGAESLPLTVAYVVRPAPASAAVELERLSPREAMLALLRHSVAGRLFDGELRRRHLDFGVKASSCLRVFSVSAPRNLDRVAEVSRAVMRHSGRATG